MFPSGGKNFKQIHIKKKYFSHLFFPPKINCTLVPSPCHQCKDDRENWVCLTCYEIRCSRYVNGHQNDHFKETGHCIAASFSDLSVWCYNCDSYIKHSTLRPFLKQLCDVKFGPQ